VEHPWEHSLKWADAKLVEVIANFWLVHLEKLFKQFAQRHDTLLMRADRIEVAVVFAVDSSEYEVAVLLAV